MYGLFVIDFISRVGINAIFLVVQADLGLSDMEVGMMGSIVLLGMAILVLPVSFLGEKYSPKKSHQFIRTGMECRYTAFRYGQQF